MMYSLFDLIPRKLDRFASVGETSCCISENVEQQGASNGSLNDDYNFNFVPFYKEQ